MRERPVLVTGATGYIGGRLTPLLLESGYKVRAMGRSEAKIRARKWGHHPNLQVAVADMQDLEAVTEAARGCCAAYYLVHSMAARGRDYAHLDRVAAHHMVKAATSAGLERIIYLSGLGEEEGEELSKHLRSRSEVADLLSLGPVPVTTLRAAMVLGSGSASFETMRYLVDRLPVMITPHWVHTRCQPISIRNVLVYLIECLEKKEVLGRSFDIGGPDIVTYAQLFDMYASIAGLRKRILIHVPVLSPRLSSYWVGLLTPVPPSLSRALAEGLRNEVICKGHAIRDIIPQKLVGCREAIRRALGRVGAGTVETCCHDAGECVVPEWAVSGDPHYTGGTVFRCAFRITYKGAPEDMWPVIRTIGGETGWYFADSLWKARGGMDKLIGGVGMRRGRRHPTELREGDDLDFWRVIRVVPEKTLMLMAEMQVGGRGILELRLDPAAIGETTLTVTASFLPKGIPGLLYWLSAYPFHAPVFKGMLRNMAKKAGVERIMGPLSVAGKK